MHQPHGVTHFQPCDMVLQVLFGMPIKHNYFLSLQYLKKVPKWRLTSSLQMSPIKSWASFMAPGVGANTEKVSSFT